MRDVPRQLKNEKGGLKKESKGEISSTEGTMANKQDPTHLDEFTMKQRRSMQRVGAPRQLNQGTEHLGGSK